MAQEAVGSSPIIHPTINDLTFPCDVFNVSGEFFYQLQAYESPAGNKVVDSTEDVPSLKPPSTLDNI